MFKAKAAYGDDADSTLNRPVFIFLRFYVSGYTNSCGVRSNWK